MPRQLPAPIIIIRLDADHQKGMGHLFRMLVLKDQCDKSGLTCHFIIKENIVAKKILQERKVKFTCYPVGLAETELISQVIDRIHPIGLWIFDLLGTRLCWINKIHEHGIPVVSFDDLEQGPAGADLIINPIFGCWQRIRDEYRSHDRVLNGPEYAIVNPAIANLPWTGQNAGSSQIGLTLGGSDTYGASVRIASYLSSLDKDTLECHFFLGPHFQHRKNLIQALEAVNIPCRLHEAVPDLLAELASMRLVICSGGQTLFELLAMGIPVMAVANEPHEEETIDYFSRQNACISLGSVHKSIDRQVLIQTLSKLNKMDSDLIRMGKRGKALVGQNGVQNCLKEIIKQINTDPVSQIGIIIQARMGSSRLPGKILKKVGGMNILEHILLRLKGLSHPAKIVIATSTLAQDDRVEKFCSENRVACFRGDHENVLKRYYDCALAYGFKQIVRLTGDDPFFDIEEIDRLIDLHLDTCSDLSHSFPVLPLGVGAEIFNFNALETSYRQAHAPDHLEHVNEYILQNPAQFKIKILNVKENKKRADIRLTIDTMEDYRRACFIVQSAGSAYITTELAIGYAEEYENKKDITT